MLGSILGVPLFWETTMSTIPFLLTEALNPKPERLASPTQIHTGAGSSESRTTGVQVKQKLPIPCLYEH